MLHELPFYSELSIEKIPEAFKRYARSYRIEIIDSKDPSVQLAASKSSVKELDEIKERLQISNNSKRFAKQTQRKWRHRICSCLV